jgi:hypothetical protein
VEEARRFEAPNTRHTSVGGKVEAPAAMSNIKLSLLTQTMVGSDMFAPPPPPGGFMIQASSPQVSSFAGGSNS